MGQGLLVLQYPGWQTPWSSGSAGGRELCAYAGEDRYTPNKFAPPLRTVNRDVLRTVLASCVEACLAFWRTVRSLGFGSTPSLTNKLPFYK